ncbi:hypothetical protein AB0N07_38125 [Streptomyces sp. NPDC051172]|uniref:hypothetical protein n=1 Tax=Streptomyces sp. NPDC051172 TaxID=3155796 RepID=UPI003431DA3E
MRSRVAILAVTAMLPLTAVASLAAADQAAADPRSGEVVVTGTVDDCENGQPPRTVQITAKTNPRITLIDQNPGVGTAGAYSVTFGNIPKGKNNNGVKGTVVVTCQNDNYTDGFRIKRPPGEGDLVQRQDLQP